MYGTLFAVTVPIENNFPKTEVISYLREKSGELFEPRLVDVFLAVVEAE